MIFLLIFIRNYEAINALFGKIKGWSLNMKNCSNVLVKLLYKKIIPEKHWEK